MGSETLVKKQTGANEQVEQVPSQTSRKGVLKGSFTGAFSRPGIAVWNPEPQRGNGEDSSL